MEITEAVKTCLSKSFKLDGRASRSEYWYFVLFQFCLYFVGIVIMSLSAAFQSDSGLGIIGGLFLLVGGLFLLATLACVPANMMSSDLFPLKDLILCSPKHHLIASDILLFPEPFGPITAVIPPPWNSKIVLSANDLNPWISSLFRYISLLLSILI